MNPFTDGKDEDDVDDFEFLYHNQGARGNMLGAERSKEQSEWEQRKQLLLDERRRTEERMLQSSYNSLGLMHESEQIGIATAEELVNQREKLQNVEKNTDQINSIMRTSQKHINSMKSVFSGIKSYFSKNPDANKPPVSTLSDSPEPSKLQATIEKSREDANRAASANHPAFRTRGIDTSGFSENPQEEFSETSRQESGYSLLSQQVDKQLNQNLDEMQSGLGRLKYLAIGLGGEIDEQNEMLDRISGKVERADETVERQNRQIARLLKK